MKNDITKTYKIGTYKISFDVKNWTWVSINIFGFGVDSDLNLSKLKKRTRELVK